MNRESWQEIRSLFEAALERDEAERSAFLDRRAGTDTSLRRAVDRLLRAERETEGYLEPPSPHTLETAGAVPRAPAASLVGTTIAGYEVLRPLGHGGMGTVYEALQDSPRRRVALKVMRWTLVSPAAARRFRYESELLARLQHPGIAQIYEAGVVTVGDVETPWFAMELVAEAETILRHAAARGLSLEDRLELFRRACQAVQHGHQRGVIHRDLKPGNLLVSPDGQVKVIDFGIAKATDAAAEPGAHWTLDGGMVGTPEYMSPEQVTGSGDVDVRSDVYSLGVVLYELLTGTNPYDLADKPLVEKGRIVSEREPVAPSARVRGLPRDLDWILGKAMAKDPTRRYGSVQELAEDLRRLQSREPVLAGPPGNWYRLRKLVQRHRLAVAAALLLVLTLVAGATGTLAFALEADRRLQQFDLGTTLVHLQEARREAAGLGPDWPEQLGTMLAWLEQRAVPLHERLPELRRAVADLRRRAQPATAAELASWPESHPKAGEVRAVTRRLAALRRAQAVRMGRRRAAEPALDPEAWPGDARQLAYQARERTHPGRGPEAFGREAEGLALARLALSRVDPRASARDRALLHEVLGWALHANGLEDEARQAAEEAARQAEQAGALLLARSAARLQAAIAGAEAGHTLGELAATGSYLELLRQEVAEARPWRFASPADAFLHETLVEAIAGIEAFEAEDVMAVHDRLHWALRLQSSLQRNAGRWQQAREALRKADGVVASRSYAAHPIDLHPQAGLVPIGMNPATGLWEFLHLRSARHPDLIPVHAPDGSLDSGPDSGIVFVLVPGGTFTMGSMDAVVASAYQAPADEGPQRLVTLAPFFLAKTELTKAQWKRLTGAADPSWFREDYFYANQPAPVDDSHPVEGVSWFEAENALLRHGLALPTECQWEYACRAGTITRWYTGDDPRSLREHAQVIIGQRDATTYLGTLPVASKRPNPFGLYDMHGNVNEWCADQKLSYDLPPRPGDGLRVSTIPERLRVLRGGSFQNLAVRSRSAERLSAPPEARSRSYGVRVARPLLPAADPIGSPLDLDGVAYSAALVHRIAATVPLVRVAWFAGEARFNPALKPLTLGAFVLPADGTGVVAALGGDARGVAIHLHDWRPRFSVRSGSRIFSVDGPRLDPDAGSWRHLAGVLDAGARMHLFVDGAEVASGEAALLPRQPAEGLDLGTDSGTPVGDYEPGRAFRGGILGFRFYLGALADEELGQWAAAAPR